MNKIPYFLTLLLAFGCRSPQPTFNYDSTARALQSKLNDSSYQFYHEKHPARLETRILLEHDFRSENEVRTGSFTYRIRVDESGKHTFRALKAVPAVLDQQISRVLEALTFKPAWIGPRNYASEIDVDFVVEYEAY